MSTSFLQEHSSENFDDHDKPVYYISKFNEYGLKIFDGGHSYIIIEYCPWTGHKLPSSKRDEWFDELRKLGIDDPWSMEIPEEYESSEWYQKKTT